MQPKPELSNKDTVILNAAINALRAIGVTADVGSIPKRPAEAQVMLGYAGQAFTMSLEIKPVVNQTNLGAIAHRLAGLAQLDSVLLVTEYVSPTLAQRLRELKIPFIDGAGNAYIEKPPLLIWVSGRKPEQRLQEARATRAFQPSGLKLLFALLCQPALCNANYRDITEAAGVALGTVGWVMRDLNEAGFLIDLGQRGRKLTNKRKLLEQWVEAYARQLRPKCLIGRYRALRPDWWKDVQQGTLHFQWGGETAAAKMTHYLKPAITTLYVSNNPKEQLDVIRQCRLLKDATGDVELREQFWHFVDPDHADTVPPLLTYADLLATADDRNMETARIIYDDHLARLIESA